MPHLIPSISPSAAEAGRLAAERGAGLIRAALAARGKAVVVLATGASQFEMLRNLVAAPGLDWALVTVFHLDEYTGLSAEHPASFRRYLRERFLNHARPAAFHAIRGDAPDAEAECERLSALLSPLAVDVLFLGIGENGHLAFNDPPADVTTSKPFLVVPLDEACRRQQLGEGWFPTLDAVPRTAISMSVREILRARDLVCTVPDLRKADAVRNALEGPLTPDVPASYLRTHPRAHLFLDLAAASRLQNPSGTP